MSILSKRLAVNRINITADGRNHGETQQLLELDSNSLIVRDVKALHTKIEKEFNLKECETDLFLSTDVTTSGLGTAIAGGLLFGGVGAVIGAIAGKGRPTWIFEIVENNEVYLFRLNNDSDKKILEKYINKA